MTVAIFLLARHGGRMKGVLAPPISEAGQACKSSVTSPRSTARSRR
ncbi:hypothetical protein [Sphingopyxis terrae]